MAHGEKRKKKHEHITKPSCALEEGPSNTISASIPPHLWHPRLPLWQPRSGPRGDDHKHSVQRVPSHEDHPFSSKLERNSFLRPQTRPDRLSIVPDWQLQVDHGKTGSQIESRKRPSTQTSSSPRISPGRWSCGSRRGEEAHEGKPAKGRSCLQSSEWVWNRWRR